MAYIGQKRVLTEPKNGFVEPLGPTFEHLSEEKKKMCSAVAMGQKRVERGLLVEVFYVSLYCFFIPFGGSFRVSRTHLGLPYQK